MYRFIPIFIAALLNVIDFYTTIYIFSINDNDPFIINPLCRYYSTLRYGIYHHQYLIEFKLIIFTLSMLYSYYSDYYKFRLLIYNGTMVYMILYNLLYHRYIRTL